MPQNRNERLAADFADMLTIQDRPYLSWIATKGELPYEDFANDGLVNIGSAMHPDNQPFKPFDPEKNGWGPYDYNLFQLPEEEKAKLRGLPTTLEKALDALEADHDYLTEGGVFPETLIRDYISRKRKECADIARIPTAAEFDRYYNR